MTANCIQKTCASLRRVCAVALALCIALGALSLPVSARADAAAFERAFSTPEDHLDL